MIVKSMLKTLLAVPVLAIALMAGSVTPSHAAGEAVAPPAQDWTFNGIFGTYDKASIQRGFQVYLEACSVCHGMRLMAYRNLESVGFSEEEVSALASQFFVMDGPDEFGEMFERPAVASDRFVEPFPNEQAARAANNGAMPKDLSVIAKARGGGPDYLYWLLIGYPEEPPADVELGDGMYYNTYFPGHQIAMPQILYDDTVEYHDGTAATAEQHAWDVTNFMMWAAEPNQEDRKRMGIKVILFLIIFSGLMYAVKRRVWADVH